MAKTISLIAAVACTALILLGCAGQPSQTAGGAPRFEVDPWWPKPLPEGWIAGRLGSVCMDSHDHVIVTNRRDITKEEEETSKQAPSVLIFDLAGNLIDSWDGDWDTVPGVIHGCFADRDNNIWLTGNGDGIIQKYTTTGKLLLQIGKRGVFDTADGTAKGKRLNAGQTQLFNPAAVVVDPGNGDVYVADGYGNRRVAVFDRNGKFLRQWGRQATKEETQAGTPGVFSQVVHCIAMSNAGLLYVCDRQGDRVQVFDKMGNFQKNIWIRTGTQGTARPARHRVVGRFFARQRAEVHVRDERPQRAGPYPRSRQRQDPLELSAGRDISWAISRTAIRWRSTPRAISTWPRPIGAGGYRSSGSYRNS